MKNILNYKITDRVAEQIEKELEQLLDTVCIEDFLQVVDDFLIDSQGEYVWTEDDIHCICSLEFGNSSYVDGCWNNYYEVRELGIYICEDNNSNILSNDGEIGDTSNFIDGFLTYYTGQSEYIMESIYEIDWSDEESDCKRAVDALIEEYEDGDGEDVIVFSGNKSTSLLSEIREYVGNSDENFEFVEGHYLGKKIYKVNDKLYYLTDDSYSMNGEYDWTLQEVSKKCYDYFNM